MGVYTAQLSHIWYYFELLLVIAFANVEPKPPTKSIC